MLKPSDLFIKKSYFPVLLLHHLQKSKIVTWWLLMNTSLGKVRTSQPCGGQYSDKILTEAKEKCAGRGIKF